MGKQIEVVQRSVSYLVWVLFVGSFIFPNNNLAAQHKCTKVLQAKLLSCGMSFHRMLWIRNCKMGSKGNGMNLWRKIPCETIKYKDTISFTAGLQAANCWRRGEGLGTAAGSAFMLWAAARSRLMDELNFWSDLLSYCHPVKHFCPFWGFL